MKICLKKLRYSVVGLARIMLMVLVTAGRGLIVVWPWIWRICVAIYSLLRWLSCKRNPNEAKEDVETGQVKPLDQRMPICGNEENSGGQMPMEELAATVQRSESDIQQSRLLLELRNYYNRYVDIPAHEQERSMKVVDQIKSYLQQFVQEDSDTTYTFGDIMPQGSSYEGLKVVEPNEFDLLLPLMLEDSEWSYTEAVHSECHAPGYFFIRKYDNYEWDCDGEWELQAFFSTKSQYSDNSVVNDKFLSPIGIKRQMQSILKRAVNKIGNPNIKVRENGPAFTLEVKDDDKQISIDIVPSIKLKDKSDDKKYRLFVAKRHPEADKSRKDDRNMYNHIWRESFSENEKSIINEMEKDNKGLLICLKILKAIRQINTKAGPLKSLSSYDLKTCMLYLNTDSIESWNQDSLDDCFKKLLWKLFQFLDGKQMPNFFVRKVDLFAPYKDSTIDGIRRWLDKIISSNDDEIINKLLQSGGRA